MKPIKFNQLVISLITVVFIILIAYFFTQVHLFEQHAVDGGLVLSKKIIYPDNFVPLKDYYFGAWTSTHQIQFVNQSAHKQLRTTATQYC